MCILLGDRRLVQSARKCRERITHHAKPALEDFRIHFRKLTDGADAVIAELALCGCTNIQKISRRQRIYDFLIVFRLNNCDSIRLFVVTAEFRGNFVERNTNGNGDTQFTLYTRTDFPCDLDGASEQPYAAGYIQPCFVKPKGFNLICIIIKNFSHIAAVLLVFSIVGGYNN